MSPPWVEAVPPWEAISAVPSVAANPLATPLLPAAREKSPPPGHDGFPVRPLPPLQDHPAPAGPHGSPAPQQPPQAPPREHPTPERPQPQHSAVERPQPRNPSVERDRNADPPPPPPPQQARSLPNNPCATFKDFRSGPCNAVLNRLTR
ncbi:hypothetical protein AB0I81_46895 [Nonomuraea sp. NPDC050404]|uniref:hypothetical protein n=1 Tax=Nonomuraea sp. NPDC050404 TaxID=3155783 RepID=UPI0033ED23A6